MPMKSARIWAMDTAINVPTDSGAALANGAVIAAVLVCWLAIHLRWY